jgi:hypothetical protein
MAIAECDEEAQALVRAYAREGEFAVVVRTLADKSYARVIMLEADPAKVATWLEEAARIVDNGPR